MPIKRCPSDVTAAEIRSLTPQSPHTVVAEILEQVRDGGDRAVLELEHRFAKQPEPRDGDHIPRVTADDLNQALAELDPELRKAIEIAIANVQTVAEAQVQRDTTVELPQGHSILQRSIPVASAGVYVPGGRGSYPSTAIMCLATAKAAGVERTVLVSPARDNAEIDPVVAAVCALVGVDEVYPIGGAQAVAALAYGTETIKPVDVIVGPGNAYVAEAKRQLFGTVGIDGLAGPSELVVVADHGSDANAIALDLLAQAEHGPDSLVVLISHDPELLDEVIEQAHDIPAEMAVVLAHDIESGVELADTLAPEHLQIVCADQLAEKLANKVTRAGCLFLGSNGATAFGDYVVGSNHVLPTGGSARFAVALSAATFRRRMSQISLPQSAVAELAVAGATIARAEGFPIHAKSMEARL